MAGTLLPPSQHVPLPSLKIPGDPEWVPYDNQGPLSDVKIISELSENSS